MEDSGPSGGTLGGGDGNLLHQLSATRLSMDSMGFRQLAGFFTPTPYCTEYGTMNPPPDCGEMGAPSPAHPRSGSHALTVKGRTVPSFHHLDPSRVIR